MPISISFSFIATVKISLWDSVTPGPFINVTISCISEVALFIFSLKFLVAAIWVIADVAIPDVLAIPAVIRVAKVVSSNWDQSASLCNIAASDIPCVKPYIVFSSTSSPPILLAPSPINEPQAFKLGLLNRLYMFIWPWPFTSFKNLKVLLAEPMYRVTPPSIIPVATDADAIWNGVIDPIAIVFSASKRPCV